MQELKQNRIFHKREFKIFETKLSYREKVLGISDNETMISFEQLSGYRTSHENSNILLGLLSAFLYLVGLFAFSVRNDKDSDPNMWIFFIGLATLLLILFVFYRQRSWKIKLPNNNTYVFLYKKIPNKKIVDEFIEAIFLARNNYLRETYLQLDKNLDYENQYKKLKWLKEIEAISKQEFEAKYEELKVLFNHEKKAIGF